MHMRIWRRSLIFAAILSSAIALAQEPPPQQPPTPTPQPAPQPTPPSEPVPPETEPPVLSRAAGGAYERRESLPYFNLYLPEGQASVRLRKLIKNVLFESQI